MLVHLINDAWMKTELNRLAKGDIESLALAVTRDEYQWCWNYIINTEGWQNYIIKIHFFIENWAASKSQLTDMRDKGMTFDSILFSHDWHDVFFRSDILNMATDKMRR